jgi:hypothetical protein
VQSLKRRLTMAALIAGCALLLLPAAGQAAQIFGSRLNHDPIFNPCSGLGMTCTIVSFIHPTDPEGDPYSGGAPSDGVITKFRIRASTGISTPVTFRLADISRDPNDDSVATATAAATGPTVLLPANSELLETPIEEFDARVPTKKGQHLAIDALDAQAIYNPGGEKFSYVFGPVLGGEQRQSTEVTGELLVQATLEPDADGDGFGDETQDQCPRQASTHGACDDTAPNIGGLKVRGGKVSYRLSEQAKVSFLLSKKTPGRRVGRKCVAQTKKNRNRRRCPRFKKVRGFGGPGNPGANSLALPKRRKLRPGVYRLKMTATDAAGNKSTKTTTFRIRAKKKKKG